MAIIRKDKYLRDIASRLGKGAMYFEPEDRPALEMGGRQVFVYGVYYDLDRGELAYSVSGSGGNVIPSAHGMRPLESLDVKVLSRLSQTVSRYHSLALERGRNVARLEGLVRRGAGMRQGM